MFVTMKTFYNAIRMCHDLIADLKTEIKLMKLNEEAKLYELEFISVFDRYEVIKDGEKFDWFLSLSELKTWFDGYKEGINDITVTICDDCIDSCLESAQHQEEAEQATKKVLSSKKK